MHLGFGMSEILVLPFIWLMALGGGPGVPLGVPPLPEDPLMANVAPEQCLWYVSWSGTASPNADSANETERLLAEPEVQQLLTLIEQQIKEAVMREANGNDRESIAVRSIPDLVKLLLMRPTVGFVEHASFDPQKPSVHGGIAINTGEMTAEVAGHLKQFEILVFDNAPIETFEAGGTTWRRLPLPPDAPMVSWTSRDEYILLAFGDGSAEGIIERTETPPPKWLTKLRADLPVQRCSMVSYLNIESVYEEVRGQRGAGDILLFIHALGLDNLLALENVSGLDGKDCVSRSRLKLDGDPRGVLTILDGEPLTAEQLKVAPRNAVFAATIRADSGRILELFLETLGRFEPRAQAEAGRELKQIRDMTGIDIRKDVLKPLGDVWTFYNTPDEGLLTGLTAVVSVDDAEQLSKTNDDLIAFARAMRQVNGRRRPRRGEFTIRQFEFEGAEVNFLNFFGVSSPVAPAWTITDDQLIVGLYPQAVKAYLMRDQSAGLLADAPEIVAALAEGNGPTMVSYTDTQALFKLLYPVLQVGAQFVCSELQREGVDIDISALPASNTIARHLQPGTWTISRTNTGFVFTGRQTLPAVGGLAGTLPVVAMAAIPARLATMGQARNVVAMNNMRQLGLAMHVHHEQRRNLPPAFSADENGKPLLSWRVRILPYIEQGALYNEFHMDEPWDSPHNKALIPRMPAIYAAPRSGVAGQFKTNYLTLRSEKSMFPGSERIRIRDVKDGTSLTIMVVEVNDDHAVIWTKPDDYAYDVQQPAKGLRRPGRDSFVAVMGDGSARRIDVNVAADQLNALFTRNGGEKIDGIPNVKETFGRGKRGASKQATSKRAVTAPDRRPRPSRAEPDDRIERLKDP